MSQYVSPYCEDVDDETSHLGDSSSGTYPGSGQPLDEDLDGSSGSNDSYSDAQEAASVSTSANSDETADQTSRPVSNYLRSKSVTQV